MSGLPVSPSLKANPASFRDPAGKVYSIGGQIVRAVFPVGGGAFETVWKSGVLKKMAQQKRMVDTELLPDDHPHRKLLGPNAAYLLTHPTLSCITYPYEWSFSALKAAALAHLDLQLKLLDEGFVLSDASAFNMQFVGAQPMHIDVQSVVPYCEGMPWEGYRQFLHQFFNPLVLEAKTGVSFAPFFRGTLDGISSEELWRLLPLRSRFKPGFLLHIRAHAWGDRHFHMQTKRAGRVPHLSKARYRSLLQHLHHLIEALQPRARNSSWLPYASATSYSSAEAEAKREAVTSFIAARRPGRVLDIGCNKGDYAVLALEAGAQHVVGLDADRAAVDIAFQRSVAQRLAFTPLVADIANPSPSQGWQGNERSSLTERIHADALLALALIHHLCIGKNIPLADVLTFIVSLAPCGVIEFVPKSDPQVTQMLQFRPDIFPGYTEDAAREILLKSGRIVKETRISESGRVLFEYQRHVE